MDTGQARPPRTSVTQQDPADAHFEASIARLAAGRGVEVEIHGSVVSLRPGAWRVWRLLRERVGEGAVARPS